MPKTLSPLAELLARRTREGDLYEKLPGDRVRCFACGHRCLIPPGFDGVCRVRFNEGGVLKVPHGYVGALQVDPIEKKPFFHAMPGAKALSFGMLGCDYHCGYCFTGETTVLTDEGATTFAALFDSCDVKEAQPDAVLAFPADRRTISGSGRLRKIKAVFRHRYTGALMTVRPLYLPALRCTPDHRVFATVDPGREPVLIAAKDITPRHYLAIPREIAEASVESVDVARVLSTHRVMHRVTRRISSATREMVLMASAVGESSRSIGERTGLSASHVRHLRCRAARGLDVEVRVGGLLLENDKVRFPKERRPGVPAHLPLTESLATLLGYYCAEGCVTRQKSRPNSHTLNFSFAHSELQLAERVQALLKLCLGVESRLVTRATTLAVAVTKSSAALLFKALAGGRSSTKRVPAMIASGQPHLIEAFLAAYVQGDGHRYGGGKTAITTVSRSLADGIAFLALKLGWLPSIYVSERCPTGMIQGRRVRQAPFQYSVVWYEGAGPSRRAFVSQTHYLVPVRRVDMELFDGYVYNMAVEDEHTYLAGFFAVSNCQNWLTSQALRDSTVHPDAQDVSADALVSLARRYGARVMTSTYNEPLITSEWAIDVFRKAKAVGLVCSYVSNGNGTQEVLEYIRPWVSLYKVDLKSFRDKHYRELGGTLERVLWTIRALHEMGFWTEIVTLVVPGFNDSDEELADIARFLASVSPDIPWHVTAFHPEYKMTGPDATPVATLLRAAEIGTREGLRYVYAGNIPGRVSRWENTWCPGCGALLVERAGYRILQDRVSATGSCPDCRRPIAGFWSPDTKRPAEAMGLGGPDATSS